MSPLDQARARADALLRPIAGDRRAGVDARSDPRAELLRDEMRKDEYLRRDWPAIAGAASGLLTDLSKDIVVATCWASAAYENDGLPGLAAGLAVLQGLLEQYWEDMFPPPARIRQRDNALANFYEHVATRLQVVKTDPKQDNGALPLPVIAAEHQADLAACASLLETLHAAAQTRFAPPPPPRELRAQLARLQAALPKPTAPAPDPAAGSKSPAANTRSEPPRATSPGARSEPPRATAPDAQAGSHPRSRTHEQPDAQAAPDPARAASTTPASPTSSDPERNPSAGPGTTLGSPATASSSHLHAPSLDSPATASSSHLHAPSLGSPATASSSHHATPQRNPATDHATSVDAPATASTSNHRTISVDAPATASTSNHRTISVDAPATATGSEPLDTPPRPPPNASDVPAYLNAIVPNLLRAAHALRRQQPGDPLAYRLLRAAVWLRAVAPAPDTRGRAPLEPLPPGVRNQCESMLRSGRWPELLDASESAFAAPAHRFCLDLHRYSATALERLGLAPARTALLAELAALLHRMPGLAELHARDGTPLADPDTRALLGSLTAPPMSRDMSSGTSLNSLSPGPAITGAPRLATLGPPRVEPAAILAMSHGPVGMSSGPADHATPEHATPGATLSPALAPASATHAHAPAGASPATQLPAPSDLSTALTGAHARLAARDLPGALALLQHHADVAHSPRARFEARIALARLSLEAGLHPVARAQTTALLREADERRLADWEPQLVARVLDLHVTALRAAPRPPDGPDLQRHVDHLSVLDPAAAIRHAH